MSIINSGNSRQIVKETDLNGKKVREITMGGRVFIKEFFNSSGRKFLAHGFSVDYESMQSFVTQETYFYTGKNGFITKTKTYNVINDKNPETEYQYQNKK